jgi:hypothetical protein
VFKNLSVPLLVALTGAFLTLLPATSRAFPVSGNLDIGGSEAQVGATSLNFLTNLALPGVSPAGYGNFLASGGNNTFVPYVGDTGFIHSLNYTSQPINQTFSLSNFLIFNPTGTVIPPDIALDLSFIYTGVFGQAAGAMPPAPGQTFTPVFAALVTPANPLGLSPYNLTNTQTGSTLSLSLAGNARRISTAELSPFSGVFTEQFSVPFQTVMASIVTGGTVQNSYSATFQVTVVPEPPVWSLFGLGGIGSVGLAWLRARRKS